MPAGLPRNAAKLVAAYRHALQPRLLVPCGLALAMATWNQVSGAPLDVIHEGCLLGGFLTYKVPLILKIADDNVPKVPMDGKCMGGWMDAWIEWMNVE
jgi:hypothetical protein